MKNLVDIYGDPVIYLRAKKFNRLCDVLIDALDDDIATLKKTAHHLQVNGKNFYTKSGQAYVLMHIGQFIIDEDNFTVDQFNNKEDMLNCKNPM